MKRQDVEAWAAEAVEQLLAGRDDQLELVEVTFRPEGRQWVLRVTLDRPGGVTLDHCQEVSQALSRLLDEHDPIRQRYSLEVSSPGLDRPLVKAADYARFAGREVKLSTYAPVEGRRNWQGTLVGLVDGEVKLLVGGEEISIPLEGVARCRLVPQF